VRDLQQIYRYHDGTKHSFHRFANSLGYLDWASQPRAFRHFVGAPRVPLPPSPEAQTHLAASPVPYDRLFDADSSRVAPSAIGATTIGDLLRHSLGLSAWKQFRQSRWALRVNPSSGNLHPTEAYIMTGPVAGLTDAPAVFHYAADDHALEQRCLYTAATSANGRDEVDETWLVALTSIHWREAWKYGERAFRYCQHDLGHAVAAVRLAAALHGWRAAILPEWSHDDIAILTGIDRDEDFVDAEREEPGCVLAITGGDVPKAFRDWRADLLARVGAGRWSGRASQLSVDHVEWTFIDEVARATRDPGRSVSRPTIPLADSSRISGDWSAPRSVVARTIDARAIILKRRSALAFDGQSALGRQAFFDMLARALPTNAAPWDAMWWMPRVHLALFVHRVEGVPPGLYFLARDERVVPRFKEASSPHFAWARAADVPLFSLALGDCRALAARLSCDQDIASDGFFSLGMIADFEASLDEHGPSFYRRLFWETGVIGQVLYLEAEAIAARSTGIGCFFDDPVHNTLGLGGHGFQSLYHFTVGIPIEDERLTTESGYPWG